MYLRVANRYATTCTGTSTGGILVSPSNEGNTEATAFLYKLDQNPLIDLSFARSLVANVYGEKGLLLYDPASMFCLEISRILDDYKDTKSFCKVSRDPQRSLHYWAYAGLIKEHILIKRMIFLISEQDVEKKNR